MDEKQNTNAASGYSADERRAFWKAKWRAENKFNIVIGIAFSPVLVGLLYWRKMLTLSLLGWAAVLLLFWAIDLAYYTRRMDEYVRKHLAEEMEKEEACAAENPQGRAE